MVLFDFATTINGLMVCCLDRLNPDRRTVSPDMLAYRKNSTYFTISKEWLPALWLKNILFSNI